MGISEEFLEPGPTVLELRRGSSVPPTLMKVFSDHLQAPSYVSHLNLWLSHNGGVSEASFSFPSGVAVKLTRSGRSAFYVTEVSGCCHEARQGTTHICRSCHQRWLFGLQNFTLSRDLEPQEFQEDEEGEEVDTEPDLNPGLTRFQEAFNLRLQLGRVDPLNALLIGGEFASFVHAFIHHELTAVS